MSPESAEAFLGVLGAYLGLGVLFAVAFVTRGVQRIDAAARGMPVVARLLLLPGAMALWPLLLKRWLRHQPARLP